MGNSDGHFQLKSILQEMNPSHPFFITFILNSGGAEPSPLQTQVASRGEADSLSIKLSYCFTAVL